MKKNPAAPALLVAEERDDLRSLLSAIALAQGFSVTRAASGSEAIEILATTSFDVVLLDSGLPYVSVDAVLAYYRGRYPGAENVILTTTPGHAVPARDRRGIYSVVTKPLDVRAIADLISECAHSQHAA